MEPTTPPSDATPERARPTRAEKAALRERCRERLAAVPPAAARRAARRVADRLLALPEVASARRVFTCLSFGPEIDTWELVDRLTADGRRIYVPRAAAGEMLHVHPYPCALEKLSFGLSQPRRDAVEVPPQEIDATLDVALVLGLAFDRRRFRLGYGRGYFDRFLAGRPFPAVGVAYELQLLDRVPVEEHDVPMDLVVTEESLVR